MCINSSDDEVLFNSLNGVSADSVAGTGRKDSVTGHNDSVDVYNIYEIPKTEIHNRIVMQRKFPGPAGILPRHREDWVDDITRYVSQQDTPDGDMWSDEVYQHAILGIPIQGYLTLKEFCIGKLVNKYGRKKDLPKGKVPLLVVLISSVECIDSDAAITLMDPSGEMKANVSRSVLKDHLRYIKPGTAMILRQVSVGYFNWLNIVANNVVSLCMKRGMASSVETVNITEMVESDYVLHKASTNKDNTKSSKSPQPGTSSNLL